MYLYAKDLSERKYEFLIKKREDAGIKHFNDPNAFIECSSTMDNVYEDIDGYNPSREKEILIMFDGMIADIMADKNLFIRCRKLIFRLCLSHSLVFLFQKM